MMRLLNVHTLELEEFTNEDKTPPYAILSHRWEQDEVSFKDWRKKRITSGQGYDKIVRCCRFTKAQGYSWCWIDTCCIDKRSSAELSEAINSMFKWYEQAAVCFAYLSDVRYPPRSNIQLSAVQQNVKNSAWFTRGWTLQELLAPREILFCSADWTIIGLKRDYEFRKRLSEASGIDEWVLSEPARMSRESVAQKMCWASRRTTTRPEDMAYCLLGLFGVNMPLLYGEGGSKAFIRLQLQLLQKSTDESIFAWKLSDDRQWYGLLAPSPTAFSTSNNISCLHAGGFAKENLTAVNSVGRQEDRQERLPYLMTHKGLELHARAWRIDTRGFDFYVVDLNCQDGARASEKHTCLIALRGDPKDRTSYRIRSVYRLWTFDLGQHLQNQLRSRLWKDVGEKCFEIPQDGL